MTAALALGAGFGAGLLLLVDGLWPRGQPPRRRSLSVPPRRLLGAGALAAALGMLTGWPVLGLGAAGAGLVGLRPLRRARADIAYVEAIAAWAESLRDLVAAGHGLEAALAASAELAPAPIAPALARLRSRLGHEPLGRLLADLAAHLGDPTADLVVVALRESAQGGVANLAGLLSALAEVARRDAATRADIDAGRQTIRTTVAIILASSLVLSLGPALARPGYFAAYGTLGGQLVLAAALGLMAAGMAWLVALARPRPPERFLVAEEDTLEAPPAGPGASPALGRGLAGLVAAVVVVLVLVVVAGMARWGGPGASALLGAGFGAGLLMVVSALAPPRPSLAEGLAQLLAPGPTPAAPLGRGWSLASLGQALGLVGLAPAPADLRMAGTTAEGHAAALAVAALAGAALGALPSLATLATGSLPSGTAPLALVAAPALGLALVAWRARAQAGARRRAFRHALGAFLDVVAIALAGGRGVEAALATAAGAGGGWAFAEVREALASARDLGTTPWEGLRQLGADLGVPQLEELAASVELAGEEGARVRASVVAKAAGLRAALAADAAAAARSASVRMVVPVVVILVGLLVYALYPPLAGVAGQLS